jgi:DNA-binding NarL/FixJ family response regulator
VLMDYRLDDGNGLDAVRTLRGLMPEIKVVMLTASPNDALVTEALEAGCSGFVAKGSSIPDLLSTVRTAASGGAAFGPNVVARMMRSRSQAIDGPRLSPRELEVIMMIAAGDSTGGIAHSLGLSQHTVRNHTRNLLTKLGAHSKLEAVVIATRTGLIRLPLES